MAKGTLLTNYVDDILSASMNGKRKYNLIQNDDGTVSLEDVTTYDQIGSDFGSAIVNAICNAVNESADKNKILETLDEVVATTEKGYIPDALALKEVNNSLKVKHYTITDHAFYNNPVVARTGNMCSITLNLQLKKSVGYDETLCTVPDEVKPKGYYYGWSYAENFMPIQINPDGTVFLKTNIDADRWILATIIYPII